MVVQAAAALHDMFIPRTRRTSPYESSHRLAIPRSAALRAPAAGFPLHWVEDALGCSKGPANGDLGSLTRGVEGRLNTGAAGSGLVRVRVRRCRRRHAGVVATAGLGEDGTTRLARSDEDSQVRTRVES